MANLHIFMILLLQLPLVLASRRTQECFASSNPSYKNMIPLRGNGDSEGDITFHYSYIEDSREVLKDKLSAQISYRGKGWVGWAISPQGNMIGSEAVIGLPDEENGQSNPGEYLLGGYSTDSVVLKPNNTLMDASIEQTDSATTLTFMKNIFRDGLTMNPDGNNTFLWAVGSSNALGIHQARDVFQVDFTRDCLGTAPDQTVPGSAERSDGGCTSDNPAYENQLALDDKGQVTFYYSLVDDNAALSAQLVYRGSGWVAWAVSPDGLMVGSEAVIGLPEDGTVKKYAMSSQSANGVTPMSAQTLVDGSITQDDTATTLTFTKLLKEPNEIEISVSGPQSFLWAVGSGNELAYHKSRSTFQLDLSRGCAGASVVAAPESTKSLWRAHGILAAIGWAIAAPLAIMSSWFRDLSGGKWFKVHFYFNLMTAVLTLIFFIIAVVAMSKTGGRHFEIAHHILGLVVFIVVFFHVIGGFLRPHVEEEKTKKRQLWEYAHKTMGYFLLAASIYQVQSGIKLISSQFGLKSYLWFYWGWLIALAVISAALFAGVFLKKRKDKGKDDVPVEVHASDHATDA